MISLIGVTYTIFTVMHGAVLFVVYTSMNVEKNLNNNYFLQLGYSI